MHQNVVKTTVPQKAQPNFPLIFLSHFDHFCDCTDLQQNGIYLFYMITKKNVIYGEIINASVLQ